MHQVEYYNRFGEQFRSSILGCPQPELWTTDYAEKGPVYRQMSERVHRQQALIVKYFSKEHPVMDIGCGFGRQAILLARMGYTVKGVDTSEVFIRIARELFAAHHYTGEFACGSILEKEVFPGPVSQMILFDVLEHIPPGGRKRFVRALAQRLTGGGLLILSLPMVRKRFSSQLNNQLRRRLTQHLAYFRAREEHPYPIPERDGVVRLFGKEFTLLETTHTTDTDFYVLQRKTNG